MAMPELNSLSIIIPTVNEEKLIGRLCDFLCSAKDSDSRLIEIIVVDGRSKDRTKKIAYDFGVTILDSDHKSRAVQMNMGANTAKGDILYFVHADVLPPKNFIAEICNVLQNGADFGCFSYRFDQPSGLLKLNSRFTRKDSKYVGGGDQTLFMKRSVFNALGGYREDHLIMEDFELYWRAKQDFRGCIIPNDVIVSARKYQKNNYLRVQLANFLVFNGYRLGVQQERLANWYQALLTN